jgi:fatty-acyl-CoA synthase
MGDVSFTVGDLLDRNAERDPDGQAVVCEKTNWTHAELKARVDWVARGLLGKGIKIGDHIALLMDNRPEWLLVCLAAAKIGAVVVPINIRYRLHELAYLLTHSRPLVLILIDRFHQADFIEMLFELDRKLRNSPKGVVASEKFRSLRQIFCLSERDIPGMKRWQEVLDGAEEVSPADLAAVQNRVTSENLLYILYTSGTTAMPKGAMLAHFNLCKHGQNIAARMHATPQDRFWIPLPLFFSFACANALMTSLNAGATLVLQPFFDPEEALTLIERERCTILYANPSIYLPLLDHPRRKAFDLSSLRSGIAMGTAQNLCRVVEELGVTQINSGYGLTETSAICTMTDCQDPLEFRTQTFGRPFPGVEVVIKDPDSERRLPPLAEGEIRVKGYNVTRGYYDDPEKTAASFDQEGFFRTGDIGALTPEGYLQFKGRYKDMLKTSGINVSAVEVESFLETYPGVQEVQLCGVPDAVKDEVGVAFVKLSPGAAVKEEELVLHCKQNIASYKVPKYIRFVDDFPRTGSGKVKKFELRERFLQSWKENG